MVRPHDRDAFQLTTQILQHRLSVLKAKHFPDNACSSNASLRTLAFEKQEIKESIEGLILHWKKWSWPITEGRDEVDETTPVPPVDGQYSFGMTNGEPSFPFTGNVWESFVSGPFQVILVQFSCAFKIIHCVHSLTCSSFTFPSV